MYASVCVAGVAGVAGCECSMFGGRRGEPVQSRTTSNPHPTPQSANDYGSSAIQQKNAHLAAAGRALQRDALAAQDGRHARLLHRRGVHSPDHREVLEHCGVGAKALPSPSCLAGGLALPLVVLLLVVPLRLCCSLRPLALLVEFIAAAAAAARCVHQVPERAAPQAAAASGSSAGGSSVCSADRKEAAAAVCGLMGARQQARGNVCYIDYTSRCIRHVNEGDREADSVSRSVAWTFKRSFYTVVYRSRGLGWLYTRQLIIAKRQSIEVCRTNSGCNSGVLRVTPARAGSIRGSAAPLHARSAAPFVTLQHTPPLPRLKSCTSGSWARGSPPPGHRRTGWRAPRGRRRSRPARTRCPRGPRQRWRRGRQCLPCLRTCVMKCWVGLSGWVLWGVG